MKKVSLLNYILMVVVSLLFVVGIVMLVNTNKVAAAVNGWVEDDGLWCYYSNGQMVKGWQRIDGNWYYFHEEYGYMYCDGAYSIGDSSYYFNSLGQMQSNGWIEYSMNILGEFEYCWCYANADGTLKQNEWAYVSGFWYYFDDVHMVKDIWYQVNNVWYLFNSSGQMVRNGNDITGWSYFNDAWRYFVKPGIEAHGWQYIDGKWYYFEDYNENGDWAGNMVSGCSAWFDDKEYYFSDSGALVIGWFRTWDGNWRYASSSGLVQYGWINDSGKWYYIGDVVTDSYWCDECQELHEEMETKLFTGWNQIDGKWYYFNGNGVMQTGWLKYGDNYYYFNSNGTMMTGWQKINNQWYYFSANGIMQTGWQTIGDLSYYFYSGGQMAANTWIGNYHVNGSGVYDQRR